MLAEVINIKKGCAEGAAPVRSGMGTDLLAFCRENIKRTWKIAFWAAFIACLLIHIYKFTNTLPNHDSVFNVYFDQDMTTSGRWLLQYACGISSYFDLPWLIGLLCAVYLGITAAVVTELFEMKNPVVIVLSAVILAASPSTTETFFFEFTADGYLIGLLLSALAACLSCKGKKCWHNVMSSVCLCCSCAIYQAYISFAIVLCICWLMLRLLDGEISIKDAWKWVGRHVLICGAALAAYYGIWKLILCTTNKVAASYKGISEIGLSFSTILNGAIKSVKNVLMFYLEWNIFENPITLYAVLNIVFLFGFAFILVVAVLKTGVYKCKGRFALLLLCLVACLPAVSIWCFASEEVGYHPMMLHSLSLFYILALILFDKWVNPKVSTVFGLLIAVMVFNFAVMANISYFYLNQCYEKSYYVGAQMMERIDKIQSETLVETIVFIGTREEEVVISTCGPASKIHILNNMLERDLFFDSHHAYLYLKHTFGLDLPLAEEDVFEQLASDPSVHQMSEWPAEDAIEVIDGVIVVKLSAALE